MIAIWCNALVEVRLGDAERVAALAAQMEMLVERFALGLGRTACGWLRGWALARTGQPREGFLLIRDAYEENVRLGTRTAEAKAVAAPRRCAAGDLDAAKRRPPSLRHRAGGRRADLPSGALRDRGFHRARAGQAP